MAETISEEKKTRRSRFFIYQDGERVAIGKQYVRYEPDVKKNVYGSIGVEIIFPVKRSAQHSFALDLYPEVHEKHPEKNIDPDVDRGCNRLFVEANRSAGLQARSVCKISREDFSYDNMRILTEKDVHEKSVGFSYAASVLKGVVIKDTKWLRKGDIIEVIDCYEKDDPDSDKKILVWHCHWESAKMNKRWFEPFRKQWLKFRNHDVYRDRYMCSSSTFDLLPSEVKICSGSSIEPETIREDD